MQQIADRFWEKVEKSENGCWSWTASKDGRGYGKFTLRVNGKMVWRIAPRVAWELTNGPIPEGFWTLHRCDNPTCVNPDHLFLGTIKDNAADMVSKGRSCRGERQGNHKLTDAEVLDILNRVSNHENQSDIARQFGISNSVITHIKRGKTWAHLPRPDGFDPFFDSRVFNKRPKKIK